jgi:hypothetical protein
MARLLSARLAEEGVFHRLFLFGGDPQRLRDEGDAAYGMADIAARYASDVLIFFQRRRGYSSIRSWADCVLGPRI